MKRLKQKLRSRAGVTLVEMLCAVVILILLGLLLNSGMSMAVKSYHDVTVESEVQLLLSTAVDAIADKVRYSAVEEKKLEGQYNHDGTQKTKDTPNIIVKIADGKILVNDKRLLPDAAYGNGKYVVEPTVATGDASSIVTYHPDSGDGGTGYYTIALRVRESSGTISAEESVDVRCLNPKTEAKKEEAAPPAPAGG